MSHGHLILGLFLTNDVLRFAFVAFTLSHQGKACMSGSSTLVLVRTVDFVYVSYVTHLPLAM